MEKDRILKIYGEQYGEESGPWNLSVENKYLEYMFAKFFEENFQVEPDMNICNIGIGAGYWDRYLSYKVSEGTLTSIDINEEVCAFFTECLKNEQNPNQIKVICSDVMKVEGLEGTFDIVTMVGSARLESGLFEQILNKAFRMLKTNGVMFYQSLDENEEMSEVLAVCGSTMKAENYLLDEAYGIKAQYWKLRKL